jgi:hypothetical protein
MIINKLKTYKALLAILLASLLVVALVFSVLGLKSKSNYIDNTNSLNRVQSTYKLNKKDVSKNDLQELSGSLIKRANVYPNVYNDIKSYYDTEEKTVTLEYSTSLDENLTSFALQGNGDITLEVNSPVEGQSNILVDSNSVVYDSIRTNSTSAFLDYTNGASNPYSVSFKVKDPINFKQAKLGQELETQQQQEEGQEKPRRSINVWRDRESFIRSVHSFWYKTKNLIESNDYINAEEDKKNEIVSKEVLDDFRLIQTIFSENGISPVSFNNEILDSSSLNNLSSFPIIWPAILRATKTFSNAAALYVITSFIPDEKLINQDRAIEVVFSINNPGATRNFFETIGSFRNNNLSSSIQLSSYSKMNDAKLTSLTKKSINFNNSSYVILALILVISLGYFAQAIIRFKLQSIIYTIAVAFSVLIPSIIMAYLGFPANLMSLVGIVIGSIIPFVLFNSYAISYKKDFKTSKNASFSNSNNYLKVFLKHFDSIIISLAISISMYLFSTSILLKQASLFVFSITIFSSLIYWFIPVLTISFNYLIPWFSREFFDFSKFIKVRKYKINNNIFKKVILTTPILFFLGSLILLFTLGYSDSSLIFSNNKNSFNSFFFNFFNESLIGFSVAIAFSFLFLSVRKGLIKSFLFSLWSLLLVVSLFSIYSILRINIDENTLAVISLMIAISPVFLIQTKAFDQNSSSKFPIWILFLPISILFININFLPLVINVSLIIIWIISYISSRSILFIFNKSKSSKFIKKASKSFTKNRDLIDEQTIPMINS